MCSAFTDLSVNQPTHPEQHRIVDAILVANESRRIRPGRKRLLVSLQQWFATELAINLTADVASRIVVGASAKQMLAAVLSTIGAPGQVIATDTLTYPRLRMFARERGLDCVAVASDADGISAQALADAAANRGVSIVYVQPTLHNPLGFTMSLTRRRALAAIIQRHALIAIEDQVLAFLHPQPPPPLVRFAPAQTILIDSLSKRLDPSMNVGFALAPSVELAQALLIALERQGWRAADHHLLAPGLVVASGRLREIVALKREEVRARNRLARRILATADVRYSRHASHLWLALATHRAEDALASAAADHGVLISPGREFAGDAGVVPAGARIAIGSVPRETLQPALTLVAELYEKAASGAFGEPRFPID